MHSSRRLSLAAVFSSTFGVGLIFGFQPPLIALVLTRAGASSFSIGAVAAASLIAVILLGPIYPRVIARWGLKASVAAGMGCAATALLLMPLWRQLEPWLVLRVLTGCALGLTWIASEVWLNALSSDADRGTVMGIYGTVFSAGTMTGPVLLQWTGAQGFRPFVLGAACLMLTLVPLVALQGVKSAPQEPAPLREFARTIRGAPLVMLAALVAGLIESAGLTLLPVFGIRAGFDDGSALLLVTVFVAGNVVLQAPIGLLADRFGRRLILFFCALVSAVGPLLLKPWLMTPALLWPLVFVWGGTLYAFYSQGVAMLGEAFAAHRLPTANTVFVMVYCLGGVLGPSAGGLLLDAWPSYGLQAWLSGAALLMAAGLVLAPAGRRFSIRDAD